MLRKFVYFPELEEELVGSYYYEKTLPKNWKLLEYSEDSERMTIEIDPDTEIEVSMEEYLEVVIGHEMELREGYTDSVTVERLEPEMRGDYCHVKIHLRFGPPTPTSEEPQVNRPYFHFSDLDLARELVKVEGQLTADGYIPSNLSLMRNQIIEEIISRFEN